MLLLDKDRNFVDSFVDAYYAKSDSSMSDEVLLEKIGKIEHQFYCCYCHKTMDRKHKTKAGRANICFTCLDIKNKRILAR